MAFLFIRRTEASVSRGEARRVVVDAIEGGRSEGVTAGEMF